MQGTFHSHLQIAHAMVSVLACIFIISCIVHCIIQKDTILKNISRRSNNHMICNNNKENIDSAHKDDKT